MAIEKSKSRLGRGLSSLLSVGQESDRAHLPVMIDIGLHEDAVAKDGSVGSLASATPGAAVLQLDPASITPNPHQPRRLINDASIADLAASLRTTGLIQPIVVRQVPGGYQLIAGERRWRAAKLAGLNTIPAILHKADSATQAQMALVENIQREDLNPIDRAESYRLMMDQLGLTQAEVAVRLGEERSGIANYVRLLNLSEVVREHVRQGRLSFGHAKLLATIDDILEQQRLADLVIHGDLSVRSLETALKSPKSAVTPPEPQTSKAHVKDLEQSLTRQLGLRVQLRSTGKKGRLTIHYATLDEFDELLAKMGAKAEI